MTSSPRDIKPGGDVSVGTQRSSFQVTVNSTYGDSPPPSLPPRNYRDPAEQDRQPQQPMPQSPVQPQQLSPHLEEAPPATVTNDYDFTPKADFYADQLRASARRISQSRRLLSARYQAKPVPEAKTSISVSRPVEKAAVAQEAKPLSAIYRATEYPKGLNLVGLPDNTTIVMEDGTTVRNSGDGARNSLGSPVSDSDLHSPQGVGSPVGNPDMPPPPPPPHPYRQREARESRPLPPPPPQEGDMLHALQGVTSPRFGATSPVPSSDSIK